MARIAALAVVAGCHLYHVEHPPPIPMPAPIAIPGINTPYDDFNVTDARRWYRGGLLFSTSRGSEGNQLDIYETVLRWGLPQNTPNEPTPVHADPPRPFAPQLMSEADERGPLALDELGYRAHLAFASNRAGGAGGLDLYVAELQDSAGGYEPIAVRPLTGLNTDADDAYLSKPFGDHQRLFASNRSAGTSPSGANDIYAASWDKGATLETAPADVRRVDALSSAADDTAPYVYTNARGETEVVFVSSRAGGLGEHDLYCSRYVDSRWTPPVHLGPPSSPRDEYRPVVLEVNGTTYMIFSSTRDGGQGGYDLYVVGYTGCPPAAAANNS